MGWWEEVVVMGGMMGVVDQQAMAKLGTRTAKARWTRAMTRRRTRGPAPSTRADV